MDIHMSCLLLCLVLACSQAALHDHVLRDLYEDAELRNHARRVARSAEVDDYAIASLYGKSLESGESRRLSKRDVENHASHLSAESRDFELHLTSGERLRMSLQKRSVMDSKTKVVEHFLNKTVITRPQIRDCIFSGLLKENIGYVSLSLCDGQVVGAILTQSREFQLLPLPETVTTSGLSSADLPLRLLVTWFNTSDENDSWYQDDVLRELEDEDGENTGAVVKRSAEDRKVTIEVAAYIDRAYLNRMNEKFGLSTDQQFTDLIARKWTSVATVLHNPSMIGWDITIKVVSVQIWRENPSWYDDSNHTLGARLKMICTNTMNEPFDYIILYTANAGGAMGLSYMGGVCNPRQRCSVVQGASLDKWTGIHEFGHNLGLKHDSNIRECQGGPKGFMGGDRTVLRQCYVPYLDATFRNPRKGCLYTENVNAQNYNPVDINVP